MAYHFGAANTDHIAANGPAAWTTKMSILVRLACANPSVDATRAIVYANSFFLDFPGGSATPSGHGDDIRIGYEDSSSNFKIIYWETGFLTGKLHTVIVVFDTTLGSANLKFYADGSATPKSLDTGSTPDSALSPLNTGTGFTIGGDGTDRSFDGNLYEVAYWPTIALTGAQCAQLGTGDASGIPLPTNYWGLVRSPLDKFGGQHGTVTGAFVVDHIGANIYQTRQSLTLLGVS